MTLKIGQDHKKYYDHGDHLMSTDFIILHNPTLQHFIFILNLENPQFRIIFIYIPIKYSLNITGFLDKNFTKHNYYFLNKTAMNV